MGKDVNLEEEKYKFMRSDVRVDNLCKVIDPSIKKRTTWETCFNTLMDYLNLQADLRMCITPEKGTYIDIFTCSSPQKQILNMIVPNEKSMEVGGFNLNYVYKVICDELIKKYKLYKKFNIPK